MRQYATSVTHTRRRIALLAPLAAAAFAPEARGAAEGDLHIQSTSIWGCIWGAPGVFSSPNCATKSGNFLGMRISIRRLNQAHDLDRPCDVCPAPTAATSPRVACAAATMAAAPAASRPAHGVLETAWAAGGADGPAVERVYLDQNGDFPNNARYKCFVRAHHSCGIGTRTRRSSRRGWRK